MNILVTGANGQLGNEMQRVAKKSAHRYIFTDVTEGYRFLDITDLEAVSQMAADEAIDAIVNCAAYTNVDRAEDDADMADLLNNRAVGVLANVARQRGAVLLHISTDYVFGGNDNVPCREDRATNPLGVYGRTKLAGEQAIKDSGCRYIIIRTAWLYSRFGKNFVKTMQRLTAEKESLRVVFDQVGTPTYAADLADAIGHIVEHGQLDRQGIYHYSNEGVCSWYDFALAIRDLSGNTCDIQPCHSNEFPAKVERPHFSVLDKTKIKETFGIAVPHWYVSLRKCVEEMQM